MSTFPSMGQQDLQQQQEAAERQQQNEERKHAMLRTLLTPEASERLSRVALVKPEQSELVSQQLLQMAQSGKVSEKITDDRLKGMLNALEGGGGGKATKITFQRKKAAFGEDSDDDYSDL